MASPNDTLYYVVRETVPGTTTVTPAFKNFEYISGTDLTFDGKTVTSDSMKANRAMAGAALMNTVGGGGLKCHGRRDTTAEMFIESAIGGVFTGNTATAGSADISHTIEKQYIEKATGAPVKIYDRWTGAFTSKWGITVDPSSNVEQTFDFVSMNKTSNTTAIASSTYADAVQGVTLTGNDVGTITLGGLTGVIYTSLDFSCEQAREGIWGLGSAAAVGVGVSASPRVVKATVKVLRNTVNVAALAGTYVPFSVALGKAANSTLTVACSKMLCSIPQDEISGGSAIVALELTAVDGGTGDLTVTRS